MDISELLSPDSNPQSGNSTSVPASTSNNATPSSTGPSPHKALQRTRSDSARKGKPSSPLAQQVYAPSGLPESSSPATGPPVNSNVAGNKGTPSLTDRSSSKPQTSGMDALADLAAMQHHQPQRQNAPSVLRSTESYENQLSPSTIHPHVNPINHNTPTPRAAVAIGMPDGSSAKKPARIFANTSLGPDGDRLATELHEKTRLHSHLLEAHVGLIGVLHSGFVNHVYPPNNPDIHGDPRRYDLLADLRAARESMDELFAMGEDLWAEWIQDESMLAQSVNERIAVMELCQRSVEEEFGSTKLWHIYGEWVFYLYSSAVGEAGPGSWTEEDRLIGREVFSWQSVLDVWQRAAEATQWRINNSHLVWDRLLEFCSQDLARAPSQEKINHLRGIYDLRLQTPHATWDQTFQTFSGFISTYYESNYEDIMSETVSRASGAKKSYTAREDFEFRLSKAQESGDRTLEWTAYTEYIDWELTRNRRKREFHFELANAIYQRAVLRFHTDVSLWEDYVMFLIGESVHGHASTTTIATLDRGTRHCPWSGNLWSQYLLSSEREGQSFSKISGIKHKATSTGLLDAGGLEEVLKVHTTWCSYLRRRAFLSDSTDEDLDVAEVGIRSAIESVQELLNDPKYGSSSQGDPLFRLDRIYIRYLSESGSWDSAREAFKGLVPRLGNSYEFWLTYYNWELISWSKFVQGEATVDAARRTPTPSYATAVLKQAIKRTDLDWPEKIVQTYISHCEDYEDSDELQLAVVETRKAMRAVNARREREMREAAAIQQQQQQQWEAAIETASSEKRKREDEQAMDDGPSSKKTKGDKSNLETAEALTEPAAPRRDREHSTVVVKNLPAQASEHQVRQFFRHIGTINGVKMIPSQDEKSQAAFLEFDTKEEALGALTRDQKPFDENTIEVTLDARSTLWVTNFSATADESSIRDLFSKYGHIVDVRLPSLKFDQKRRFCYVQFASSTAAHQATELDGTETEGGYKLVAKISDPSRKQERSGPLREGREIYLSNIDWSLSEDDIRSAFAKFGTVDNINLPRDVQGKSRGFGFLTFSSKEEAADALSMHDEMLGKRRLQVQRSTYTGAKRMASTIISRVGSSASPPPETNSAGAETVEVNGERGNRTFALMNIPDTVNDARIRALLEPFGRLVKIILRPDHQGAIVEFVDVNDAGKASLELEGKEIAPGRPLHIGSVTELKALQAEHKTDRVTSIKQNRPKSALPMSGPIKRPQQPGGRGGRRGGLGMKRATGPAPDRMDTSSDGKDGDSGKTQKSNDDFRAMLSKHPE
ncbi:hypothetical protein N7492_008775 [Penicillium capsulatum]|uniref:U4/U6 snRNA-associated-splicing factor PRP24 n=1 Tax=Penicillium capsulatum TaxID=69766 RepID=A0A9W9HS15_9EURO|nr:hypothetical protein N7492_008775 [Penicillium capsulatum]KAJ6106177.1 hypothetical protein N7512_009694 [Penicillium capsulatum]